AEARQVMYAARGDIQELTGKTLDDQYFTQTLLPDYLIEFQNKTARWDVVFDDRGHFTEPHTELEIGLGTLGVRGYLSSIEFIAAIDRDKKRAIQKGATTTHADMTPSSPPLHSTSGPKNRFGAILFIEKEGFLPLFKAVRLAERYDIAIMSTKGMSNTAARRLVDSLCQRLKGVPLLIVRDFDKAGFSIASTLQNDTRRYGFKNRLVVHDLGLRLTDVGERGRDTRERADGA